MYRIRFTIAGGHIHCALFYAPASNQTFAKCGEFIIRKGAEFEALLRSMSGVDFIGHMPHDGIVEASKP